jgi:hypothetical protein
LDYHHLHRSAQHLYFIASSVVVVLSCASLLLRMTVVAGCAAIDKSPTSKVTTKMLICISGFVVG